ncbi:MAG: transcription antitermination protein NusB [Chlamydiae bacterium]|nr:transcription antitermination protein NusB [Chlamydiota bacterium]
MHSFILKRIKESFSCFLDGYKNLVLRKTIGYTFRMSLNQSKFREIVYHFLFARPDSTDEVELLVKLLMHFHKTTKKNVLEAFSRYEKILPEVGKIDEAIQKTSKEYDSERITKAEKVAIELCAYEMLYDAEIPEKVAIAEAIRLTKKYGSKEGAGYVNAIMDTLYHQREAVS